MEQLDDSDGNGHKRNTNTNNIAPLFELDYEEGSKPRMKPNKTPVVVISEDEDE